MTDQITFTLGQVLAFGTFLMAVVVGIIGVVIKLMRLGASVNKIKKNDLSEFIKRGEFEDLTKEVGEMGKTLVRLDERSKDQEKQIDSLFRWKNSKG